MSGYRLVSSLVSEPEFRVIASRLGSDGAVNRVLQEAIDKGPIGRSRQALFIAAGIAKRAGEPWRDYARKGLVLQALEIHNRLPHKLLEVMGKEACAACRKFVGRQVGFDEFVALDLPPPDCACRTGGTMLWVAMAV